MFSKHTNDMKKNIHSLGCKTALLYFVFSLLTLHGQNTSSVTQSNTVLSSATTKLKDKSNPVSSKNGKLTDSKKSEYRYQLKRGGAQKDTSKSPFLKDNSVLNSTTNAFKSVKNSNLKRSTAVNSNNSANLGSRNSNLQNPGISEVAEKNSSSESSVSPFEAMKGKAEDLSKRDAFAKHYKNSDGSFTAVIGLEPLHYLKNGKWEEISLNLTKVSSINYAYSNTMNVMESYFGSTSHEGILSMTKEGEVKEFLNTKMYWEVNGKETGVIQSSDAGITVKDNQAYYNNLYGDISAEFLIETGKRKLI